MPPTALFGLRKKVEQESVSEDAAQGPNGATVNSENVTWE